MHRKWSVLHDDWWNDLLSSSWDLHFDILIICGKTTHSVSTRPVTWCTRLYGILQIENWFNVLAADWLPQCQSCRFGHIIKKKKSPRLFIYRTFVYKEQSFRIDKFSDLVDSSPLSCCVTLKGTITIFMPIFKLATQAWKTHCFYSRSATSFNFCTCLRQHHYMYVKHSENFMADLISSNFAANDWHHVKQKSTFLELNRISIKIYNYLRS